MHISRINIHFITFPCIYLNWHKALFEKAALFPLTTHYIYVKPQNFISFLFVLIKSLIFIIVPLMVYLIEKNEIKFKKVGGIYASYFIVNLFVTIIVSFSFINGDFVKTWVVLFDFVNLFILLSSLFILIEQILLYAQIKNKVYSKTIMKIVYLVANFVSYPFLSIVDKKINKHNDEE